MPQSIRFFIHNRWNKSTSVANSSGARTGYAASQTQTLALAETWRSLSVTNTYLGVDLASALRIGAVCLVRCNLTNGGSYRVRIGNTANFSTNLYDSGWSGRRRYYSDSELAIAHTSEFFPEGLPISNIQKLIQRQIIVIPLPTEVTARYIRIDFDDASNPDGYIEIGYAYAGIVLEPSRDLMYGWKIQREDFVRDGQAACGQYWSKSVYNKTLLTLTLAPQRESDMTNYWLLLESLVSINCEFIVSLIQRSNSLLYTTTIFGKFAQVPNNQSLAFSTWGIANIAIEELVD